WLAESWEEGDDGMSATFHLREGITFHDGTPFTAEVAAENLNYHTDRNNPSTIADVLPAGLQASGSGMTLEVTAEAPNAFLVAIIGSVRMVGSAGLTDPDSLERASNGTGLFAMTGVQPGRYTFE